jgi:hypothetical protein
MRRQMSSPAHLTVARGQQKALPASGGEGSERYSAAVSAKHMHAHHSPPLASENHSFLWVCANIHDPNYPQGKSAVNDSVSNVTSSVI